MDLVHRLHDIRHYAPQHFKVASDRMKARYDRLANSTGFQEGNKVWLYRPTRTRGRPPTLVTLGRPAQDDHQDQRRGLPDPTTSDGEDDGGTPGQTGTMPRVVCSLFNDAFSESQTI
jgi:hypothetical protein